MKYRKPHSINAVTFMLLAGVGLMVYVLVCLWPVYMTRSKVKGILLDQVPALYKANLVPDEASRAIKDDIRKTVAAELTKAGLNPKAVKLFLRHNKKEVELEARFKATAHFPFPDKTYEFDLAPKVVSDATRVEW
jgi:hypothetical protein